MCSRENFVVVFVFKDGKIEAEDFTSRLYRELNSSPQPYLVPFLKVNVETPCGTARRQPAVGLVEGRGGRPGGPVGLWVSGAL